MDGELARRQARQLSPQEKRERADRVLPNDGGTDALRERTLELLEAVAPRHAAGETATNKPETNDSGR